MVVCFTRIVEVIILSGGESGTIREGYNPISTNPNTFSLTKALYKTSGPARSKGVTFIWMCGTLDKSTNKSLVRGYFTASETKEFNIFL